MYLIIHKPNKICCVQLICCICNSLPEFQSGCWSTLNTSVLGSMLLKKDPFKLLTCHSVIRWCFHYASGVSVLWTLQSIAGRNTEPYYGIKLPFHFRLWINAFMVECLWNRVPWLECWPWRCSWTGFVTFLSSLSLSRPQLPNWPLFGCFAFSLLPRCQPGYGTRFLWNIWVTWSSLILLICKRWW